MARFRQEHTGDDGWSRWVTPVMDGYRMACCDCGLVHTIEFRVTDDGEAVQFRVRRNNRSTAQLRRHQNITVNVQDHDAVSV